MNKIRMVLVAVICLAVVALAVVVIWPRSGGKDEVLVLCGGSIRAVLEEIVEQYKKVSDDKVIATYGDSGELCAQIQHTGKGDIYVCHDPFMPWAKEKGLIAEWNTVGYLDVVIVVPKDNPKGIRELKDLARPGIRLGIGNTIYATSGVLVNNLLKKLDYGEAISKNVRVESKGHQQRCTDVIMGSLDAAIVWQAVAHLSRDKLESISIPRDYIDAVTSATYGYSDLKNVKVTVGMTLPGRDKESARRFYQFMTTKCRDVFKEYGFRPVEE